MCVCTAKQYFLSRSLLRLNLILFVAFIVGHQFTFASEFASESDYFDTIPIGFSSLRLEQHTTESPNTKTIIDAEWIAASGARDIVELLRFVPGFQLTYLQQNLPLLSANGNIGNYQRRIKVLIDGRTIYIPLLSSIDWSALEIGIDDIERIEVVHGPNSSSYGSNAASASINIVTKKSYLSNESTLKIQGGTNNGRTTLSYTPERWIEGIDDREVTLSDTGVYSGVGYRFSTSYREDKGFRHVNDSRHVGRIFLHAEYNPTAIDIIDFQIGVSHGSFGLNVDPHSPILSVPREKNLTNNFQKLSWVRELGKRSYSVQLYQNWYSQRDRKRLGTLVDVMTEHYSLDQFEDERESLLDQYNTTDFSDVVDAIYGLDSNRQIDVVANDGDAQSVELEGQVKQSFSNKLRIVLGGGISYDRIRNSALFEHDGFEGAYLGRFFTQFEWKLFPRLSVSGGGTTEYSRYAGLLISPNFGANFQIHRRHYIRGDIARAYRAPSLLEQNVRHGFQFSDNHAIIDQHEVDVRTLRSERTTRIELGYMAYYQSQRITYDFSIYGEELQDGIVNAHDVHDSSDTYLNDGEFEYWFNGASATTYGLKAQLAFRPIARTLFVGSYTFAKCRSCRMRESPDEELVDVRETLPTHQGSFTAQRQVFHNTTLSVSYVRVPQMKWLGDGETLAGHDRWDAVLRYNVNWHLFDGNIALTVNNLLGSYYEFNSRNLYEPRVRLATEIVF